MTAFGEDKSVSHTGRFTKARQSKKDSIHFSATSSEYKSELSVFSALKNIKRIYPKSMKISIILLLLQAIISLVFSILYFQISHSYINNYFKPIQIGVREFSNQYHLNGIMMFSSMRVEYCFLNIIDSNLRKEYQLFIERIYNDSLKELILVNDRFRNVIYGLNFEKNYKERGVAYIDGFDFKLKTTSYINFIDIVANNVNSLLPSLITMNTVPILDYKNLIFLIRNFPSYLTESSFIYTQLIDEFMTSDEQINQNFFNLLIIFIIICTGIKLYEIFQWNNFMILLKNILAVYLRINEEDLEKEISNLKDFLKIMKDSNDKYFDLTVQDITKKEKIFQNQKNNQKFDKNVKKSRRALFSRFQGLPKLFIVIYYFFWSLVLGFYFIFSYYNWIVVDKYIVKLTNTNALFSNTYIYSDSVIYLEDVMYREKIIRNPEYENMNISFQTKNGRLTYLKNALDKRMNLIANTSAMNIILDGVDDSQKLGQLKQVLSGNLCELIAKDHNFDNKQTSICEGILNGAFTKGLGNAISELFKSIKSRELTLQYFPQTSIDEENQQKRIKEFINSKDYLDMYLAEIFLHETLEKFYNLNNDFYNEYLEKELSGFYIFLYITLVSVILLNWLFIYLIKNKIRLMYQLTCRVLFLIPYERMIKDEQMLNFLKRLSRN